MRLCLHCFIYIRFTSDCKKYMAKVLHCPAGQLPVGQQHRYHPAQPVPLHLQDECEGPRCDGLSLPAQIAGHCADLCRRMDMYKHRHAPMYFYVIYMKQTGYCSTYVAAYKRQLVVCTCMIILQYMCIDVCNYNTQIYVYIYMYAYKACTHTYTYIDIHMRIPNDGNIVEIDVNQQTCCMR